MDIDIDDNYKKGTVTVINEMSQNNDSIARYYEKKIIQLWWWQTKKSSRVRFIEK